MTGQAIIPEQDQKIEITPEMIEAGVAELRELLVGGDLSEAVSEIYMAMELERRARQPR